MTAQFPIEITAKDRYSAALEKFEKRFERVGKNAEKTAKPMLAIEKSLDRILKPFGLDRFVRDFDRFGQAASGVSSGIGDIASSAGLISESAAGLAGGLTIVVAAAGAAGGAIAVAANKYDEAGASLEYFSKTTGVSVRNIQTWIGAADKMQVSADEAKNSILSIRTAIAGAFDHPLAAQILQAKGYKIPKAGERIDTNLWLDRVAKIMAAQDPGSDTEARVAQALGVPAAMIPFFHQGPTAIEHQRTEVAKTTDPYTPEQAAKAAKRSQEWRAAAQATGGLFKSIGDIASDIVAPFMAHVTKGMNVAARGVDAMNRNGAFARGGPAGGAAALAPLVAAKLEKWFGVSGTTPGVAATTVDVRQAMAKINAARGLTGAGFDRFAAAIERQESSGGHQFRRTGVPLVSPRGAVGAMQILPETAAQIAKAHGIDFDAGRLAFDKTYNEMLGKLHLQDLLKKYSGSQTLAAAAYNAGESIVDDWLAGTNLSRKNPKLRHLADPRLGALQDAQFRAGIPGHGPNTFQQTRDYVAATVPQQIEVNVKFTNAPAGTVADAKSSGGAKIKLQIGHAMPAPS